LSEDILHKADEKDADAIKKEIEILGEQEMYATYVRKGRGRMVRDICQAAGIIVSRVVERHLATRLGCKHIALLDKAKEQLNV
jgi:hypothetical protein